MSSRKIFLCIFAGKDVADEGHLFRRFVGKCDSSLDAVNRFGQHSFICGVQRGKGLSLFYARTTAGVELDARVRIDGFCRPFRGLRRGAEPPSPVPSCPSRPRSRFSRLSAPGLRPACASLSGRRRQSDRRLAPSPFRKTTSALFRLPVRPRRPSSLAQPFAFCPPR